jgi:hypothetical protein
MSCVRCQAEQPLSRAGWCSACEKAYDTWVRRHATDIVWSVLGGGLVIALVGLALPLLGLSNIVAFAAAFAGWGAIFGLQYATSKRRRRQFLGGAAVPRAYLPWPQR